jgi:tRNA 2-selenouridine synthase SelU
MREELREEMEDKVREIEVRLEAKMREEMKSQLALLVQQSMGQQVQTFTPTVLQSSSQSVKPIADLSGYTEVMQIQIQ